MIGVAGSPLTVHLGESRVWIGDGHSEWEGGLVEPAAVRLTDSDHLAVGDTAIPAVEALAAVLGAALAQSGLAARRTRTVVLTCPSYWGAARRTVLAAAARRVAPDIDVVPVALCPGLARVGRRGYVSGRARCIVLEFGELTTTAGYVTYDAHGSRLESCEHRTTLAPTEIRTNRVELAGLLAGAAAHRHVDAVLVVGNADPAVLDAVTAVSRDELAPNVDIRPVAGRDLVKAPPHDVPTHSRPEAPRGRAALRPEPPRYRRRHAVASIVAVVAAVAIWCQYRSGSTPHPIPEPSPKATIGRVTVTIPVGWRIRPAIAGESVDTLGLVPIDGSRSRIEVTQNTLQGDPDLEQVRADLRSQRDNLGKQTDYSDIARVVFGGRAVLLYEQLIEANSQAKHHVIVEHGTQVSVDCQYLAGGWDAIEGACEDVVASATVGP